jgi:catechol 2,3-dioxygenase-like lactoylglutathione lyase family enzyme
MWGRKTFYFGDNVSVGVRDVSKAVAWYQEKLGLRLTPLTSEDFDAFLGFSKDDEIGLALVAIPAGQTTANVEAHPILSRRNSKRAERSSPLGESRWDRFNVIQGGTPFFSFKTLRATSLRFVSSPERISRRRPGGFFSHKCGFDHSLTSRRFSQRRTPAPA